jgi:hypothetical protein
MNDPRKHHFQFAHQRLSELAFRNRHSFLSLMMQSGIGFLQGAWYQLGRTLPRKERLKADGLAMTFFESEKYCGAVVTMPAAVNRTEAHMVTLISHRISGSILLEDGIGLECWGLRYFTLERGREKDGVSGTILGEWTRKGHTTNGSGPIVDAKALWSCCIAHIQRENESVKHDRKARSVSFRHQENLLRYCHPAFWAL